MVFYTPFVGAIISSAGSMPPGGAETQILLLAKTLVRRGLRVAIIAYGEPSELPEELEGVEIVPRPPYRKHRAIGKFVEMAQIWGALWRCPSRVVVYRCAGLQLGLIALYTRTSRRRLVFSTANVIDFDFERLAKKRRDVVLYKLGVRLADAIVVQTEEQIELCRRAFGRRPTLIKSLVVLADRQRELPEAFLWIGRLVSYKRPLEYLELAKAIPEARFWMVGVPALHAKTELQIGEAVSEIARQIPNLEMLSPRPHNELQELMARAVASVNTADFEGMPNVLLEAWSRGVPALVLTHDPGGVVTTHGLGGFADGSRDHLVALARAQWRSRDDRAQLAERCQAYVASQHDPDLMAERWMSVLDVQGTHGEPREQISEGELSCAG